MRLEHTPAFPLDVFDVRPFGESWGELKRDGTLLGMPLDLSGLDLEGPVDLHVANDLRHVAITERFGPRGRVFAGAESTMELNRSDYVTDASVFPIAFFEDAGRTLLVHGTDWNRLDISDPATADTLTSRGPTAYREGEPVPPRYLDYFYGGLHVSPDGRRIVTDGWRWHPLGQVRVWSLDAWLTNPWESEDGPSVLDVVYREDWDMPLCWIDHRTLAIWGTGGYEEDAASPAIWAFDIEDGTRRLLAEPEAFPSRPWPPKTGRQGWMAFADGLLFAIDPNTGTAVWTLAGERLHFEAGFAPRRYHPDRREFSSWEDGKIRVSRLVP